MTVYFGKTGFEYSWRKKKLKKKKHRPRTNNKGHKAHDQQKNRYSTLTLCMANLAFTMRARSNYWLLSRPQNISSNCINHQSNDIYRSNKEKKSRFKKPKNICWTEGVHFFPLFSRIVSVPFLIMNGQDRRLWINTIRNIYIFHRHRHKSSCFILYIYRFRLCHIQRLFFFIYCMIIIMVVVIKFFLKFFYFVAFNFLAIIYYSISCHFSAESTHPEILSLIWNCEKWY